MKNFDSYHKALLDLIKNIWRNSDHSFSIREIWTIIWLDHPQKVSNRLKQLEDNWYIKKCEDWIYRVLKDFVWDLFNIPFYWFAQCWNMWWETIEETPKDTIEISNKLINISDKEIKNCFFTRAKWNSMQPIIDENDLLLIRKQDFDNTNNMFLVIHDWKPKIKKILKKGDDLFLVSVNYKEHPNLEIDKFDDDIRVIWVVKQVIKNY